MPKHCSWQRIIVEFSKSAADTLYAGCTAHLCFAMFHLHRLGSMQNPPRSSSYSCSCRKPGVTPDLSHDPCWWTGTVSALVEFLKMNNKMRPASSLPISEAGYHGARFNQHLLTWRGRHAHSSLQRSSLRRFSWHETEPQKGWIESSIYINKFWYDLNAAKIGFFCGCDVNMSKL